ncbi:hypothetical protein EVB14_10805 [Neisseria meningitidis]|nr:hypothetical protein [Neisseria meningitidis]
MPSEGHQGHRPLFGGGNKKTNRCFTNRDLCKIPFPPDSRNPNTGFRLFSLLITPNSAQIPP